MPNDFDTSQYPLGSMHPYVLYNNAGNEDLFVNDIVNETWVDRPPFNRVRKTIYGMEQEFLRALEKMGYETTYLTYVNGSPLQVDRPTQLISRGGSIYAVKLPASFPLTLTGTWATDSALLVDVGDQSLRTALAAVGGWDMINTDVVGQSVHEKFTEVIASVDDLRDDVTDELLTTVTSKVTADGGGREVPNANHFMRYDLHATKRPKPSGMSWLPFEVLGFRPNGKLAISKTAEQVFLALATLGTLTSEGFVDVNGGSDANNGTPGQPWASVSYAVTQAAYVTRVAVGAYGPFATLDRTLTSGNRARRIRGSGRPVGANSADPTKMTVMRATGDVLSAATWAISSSPPVNTTTLSTANGVVAVTISNYLDEFGRPLPLTKRANATEVSTLGGWYYDTGTKLLSVRYGTTANFNANVKPNITAVYNDATTNGYLVCQGAEVYFENILFVGCFPQALTSAGTPAKLVFKNCGFWFSRASAIINQGSAVVLEDCEIYRCIGDGVNSHSISGVEADHIVINTEMNYCGDFDTVGGSGDNNQNGASMHENGRCFVGGCKIFKSSGPGLIDTGSGPGSTGVSWWIGNHVEQSLGNNPTNYDTYGVRKVWIESCSETGDGAVPVRASESGTIIRYGSNAVRGYTPASSGLTVAYDPLDPV